MFGLWLAIAAQWVAVRGMDILSALQTGVSTAANIIAPESCLGNTVLTNKHAENEDDYPFTSSCDEKRPPMACISAFSSISLLHGAQKFLSDIQIGDQLQGPIQPLDQLWSNDVPGAQRLAKQNENRVALFLHDERGLQINPSRTGTSWLRVNAFPHTSITVSPSHLFIVRQQSGVVTSRAASALRPLRDQVYLYPRKRWVNVTSIEKDWFTEPQDPHVAPLPKSGVFVADGLLMSAFSQLDDPVLTKPLRSKLFRQFLGGSQKVEVGGSTHGQHPTLIRAAQPLIFIYDHWILRFPCVTFARAALVLAKSAGKFVGSEPVIGSHEPILEMLRLATVLANALSQAFRSLFAAAPFHQKG